MNEADQGMMTFFEAEAHSFVLRIWRENRNDPDTPAEWRGWVDHVQSGSRTYFRDLADINRILNEHINPASDEFSEQIFMPIQPKDHQE